VGGWREIPHHHHRNGVEQVARGCVGGNRLICIVVDINVRDRGV
jgi:hypothetical protein